MVSEVLQHIDFFASQHLEAIAKILGHTSSGLTGSEIGSLLRQCNIPETDFSATKWKRLSSALINCQKLYPSDNKVILFIEKALDPASYMKNHGVFDQRRSTDLNGVLLFSELSIDESGTVIRT